MAARVISQSSTKLRILSLCVPALLLLVAACDSGSDAKTKDAEAKADDKAADKADKADKQEDEEPSGDAKAGEDDADEAAAGGPDDSGLDETGKQLAKLWDETSACEFDMNSQIRGCKSYDAIRAMQKAQSPMTAEFLAQFNKVAISRLTSKDASVRGLSFSFMRHRTYKDNPDLQPQIDAALAAEKETAIVLVALRALRDGLKDSPSLVPLFEAHAKSEVKEVAETARAALDKAAG